MRSWIAEFSLAAALALVPGVVRPLDVEAAVVVPEASPGEQVQPQDEVPPEQFPPAPPSPTPPAPPPQAQAADSQTVPSGSWVYTAQYGWVWMPYADAYTYVPPSGYGEPYMYVYYPAGGWSWVVAPWLWGWGPLP